MKRILDLSHPVATGIPAWTEMAGTFGLARTLVNTWEDYEETAYLRTHGKVQELFRTCLVIMSDNGGTHVDGTRHFDPLGEWAPEIPLEPFYGSAVLLDVSHLRPVRYDPERRTVLETDWITPEVLEQACTKAGVEIQPRDIVLIRTGGGEKWPRLEYHYHIVPFRVEGVEWMLDRGVVLYGVDQITIDIIPGYDLPHMLMRKRYHMIMENLANLHLIDRPRFRFVGFPLKWEGASCSPLRAVAIFD